jgi:exodeoxyribonuclease VII large subunit
MVIPAQVQGAGASATIVAALAMAHQIDPAPDIVILSRGGGSLEDLWCFNEENVVRAVAASEIPTISAVGHEVDITLCDLAADVRALTPTDAATKAIPDQELLSGAVASLQSRLDRSVRSLIANRRLRIDALTERPIMRKPLEILHLRARRLDELDARGKRAIDARVEAAKSRIATAAAALSALSPLHVLTRGYSVTLDQSGQPVESADSVRIGEILRTKLHQGELESTVTKVEMPQKPGPKR